MCFFSKILKFFKKTIKNNFNTKFLLIKKKLLMMTMNGYVEIVISLGLACGYFFTNAKKPEEKEPDCC